MTLPDLISELEKLRDAAGDWDVTVDDRHFDKPSYIDRVELTRTGVVIVTV